MTSYTVTSCILVASAILVLNYVLLWREALLLVCFFLLIFYHLCMAINYMNWTTNNRLSQTISAPSKQSVSARYIACMAHPWIPNEIIPTIVIIIFNKVTILKMDWSGTSLMRTSIRGESCSHAKYSVHCSQFFYNGYTTMEFVLSYWSYSQVLP